MLPLDPSISHQHATLSHWAHYCPAQWTHPQAYSRQDWLETFLKLLADVAIASPSSPWLLAQSEFFLCHHWQPLQDAEWIAFLNHSITFPLKCLQQWIPLVVSLLWDSAKEDHMTFPQDVVVTNMSRSHVWDDGLISEFHKLQKQWELKGFYRLPLWMVLLINPVHKVCGVKQEGFWPPRASWCSANRMVNWV